jgi:hypothetical protein
MGWGDGEARDGGREKSGAEEEDNGGCQKALSLSLLSSSNSKENKKKGKTKSNYEKCNGKDFDYINKGKGGKDEGKREVGIKFTDKNADCYNNINEDNNNYVPLSHNLNTLTHDKRHQTREVHPAATRTAKKECKGLSGTIGDRLWGVKGSSMCQGCVRVMSGHMFIQWGWGYILVFMSKKNNIGLKIGLK